jgi:RhtB (resistance to homoserine/threonine) family protein
MIEQFFTIGILMLLSAMLPGPDFALVSKNTILHSRRSGLFTTLGLGCAILIHITYCALGLALIISKSLILFSVIKYVGAAYLIYLGISSLLAKPASNITHTDSAKPVKTSMTSFAAFRQGFFCNLLNPKATLFFLALFTVIIKPETPAGWVMIYALEMFLILTGWFCALTLILSHPRVLRALNKMEKYITKILGVFFIGFGVALAFVEK